MYEVCCFSNIFIAHVIYIFKHADIKLQGALVAGSNRMSPVTGLAHLTAKNYCACRVTA